MVQMMASCSILMPYTLHFWYVSKLVYAEGKLHYVIPYNWTCPKLLQILEGKTAQNAYPPDKGSVELCLHLAEASDTPILKCIAPDIF